MSEDVYKNRHEPHAQDGQRDGLGQPNRHQGDDHSAEVLEQAVHADEQESIFALKPGVDNVQVDIQTPHEHHRSQYRQTQFGVELVIRCDDQEGQANADQLQHEIGTPPEAGLQAEVDSAQPELANNKHRSDHG